MQAICQFYDNHSHVLSDGDHEFGEVVLGVRQIALEVAHAGARLRHLGDAIDQKGDIAPKQRF